MTRQLATIQRIVSIEPIPKADKIEVATVLGWHVVVKKGEHNAGDLITYCEVDSVLPEKPEYEFLRERKFRIKTIKLRGQISQGLILPAVPGFIVGSDVTEKLGITKYEPGGPDGESTPPQLKPTSKWVKPFMRWAWFRKAYAWFNDHVQKDWPAFVQKTDETRIQSMAGILHNTGVVQKSDGGSATFIVTEKMDGCSATYCMVTARTWYGRKYPHFMIFSRNINVTKNKGGVYFEVAEKYGIKDKLLKIYQGHGDCAVQGEIVGPKVQGNKYGFEELHFRPFQIVFKEGKANYHMFTALCNIHGFDCVPILETEFILEGKTVDDLVKYATRESVEDTVPAEGVVIRSPDMRTSFKVINPEFLLKYDC